MMNPGSYATVSLVWIGFAIGAQDTLARILLFVGSCLFLAMAVALRHLANSSKAEDRSEKEADRP